MSVILPPDTHWRPFAGPQSKALESPADIVFYGGAAGGGKTDLLIGAAHRQHRRSIIFRREYSQLKAIVDRTRELLGESGKFNRTHMIWRLDDGRMIEFGAVQRAGDEFKYQGRPHDLKAFDELTHFNEMQFRTLCGWLRSVDPMQRCRIIATGNPPTNSGGDWVIRFFAPWLDPTHAKPAVPGELRWYTMLDGKETEVSDGTAFVYHGELLVPKSRTFIPARVEDNPYYMKSGYKAILQALPEPLRSKMLYGDFSAGRMDDPYQLIPTEWIEAAMKRFETRSKPDMTLSCIGVDVARGGGDKTVITLRYGTWFDRQHVFAGKETPSGDKVAQIVIGLRGLSVCRVNIDVIGVGSSVYDHLRQHIGLAATAMNASQKSEALDKISHYGFYNKRAEWWWKLREALDPETGEELALPPDRELLSDLSSPHYFITNRGIKAESKDTIAKRIGRSPDKGDSLVYAHAIAMTPSEGYLEYYKSLAEASENNE